MTKIDCISCGIEFELTELDPDGICEPCNLEDYCPKCNQHGLDCECEYGDGAFVYGFDEDDFGDEDDPHDELDEWEGDDFGDE